MIKKAFGHILVIAKHKFYVTYYCFCSGLYIQGIFHDLSKLSIVEFFGSIRYYTGTKSPIDVEKEIKGYSHIYLHHVGRNKHHFEYWIDFDEFGVKPYKIPEKYVYEMVCDSIAAGKVYMGDKWNNDSPIEYHKSVVNKRVYHHETLKLYEEILNDIYVVGINLVFHWMKNNKYKYK